MRLLLNGPRQKVQMQLLIEAKVDAFDEALRGRLDAVHAAAPRQLSSLLGRQLLRRRTWPVFGAPVAVKANRFEFVGRGRYDANTNYGKRLVNGTERRAVSAMRPVTQ